MSTGSLEVSSLTKRFGGVTAVNRVSLEVAPGRITGVIGPNGAGKSTLMGLISGGLQPTSGEVRLAGRRLSGRGATYACRHGLGRTFQIPRAFAGMSVHDNVRVAATFGGARKTRVEEILEFCLLTDKADALPSELTHCDQRRIEFARAMATDPKFVLLDELAAGLIDSELREFADMVKEVASRGVGVLFVEHIMSFVMAIADELVVLDFGTKIADGEPEAVATDPLVISAYLGSDDDEEATRSA